MSESDDTKLQDVGTHHLLPEPDEDESYYYVKTKDIQAKGVYGAAYVPAKSPEAAEEIVEEGFTYLGLLGLRWAKCRGEVNTEDVESRVLSAASTNDVLHRDDDGEIQHVHRGMLR